MEQVVIIDHGLGNMSSICSACSYLSFEPVLTADKKLIMNAEHLILPGVGAFKDGMNALSEKGLVEPIKKYCSSDKPFLGICLGMQMLVDDSEEFGITNGLSIIKGRNIRIPQTGLNGKLHKVPHIGWAPIEPFFDILKWNKTILDGIISGTPFYFVHSYTVVADHERAKLAKTDYNGRTISAVISKGNIYGTQFHPEKSGEAGLRVLKNFLCL